MQVSVIEPAELQDSQIAAWRAMQQRQPQLRNPFLAPEFSIAVGRVLRSARVAVISDGGPIAFFPFEQGALRVGRPIAGWLSTCQGVVHAPGVDLDAQELLRLCGLDVWEFGCLVDEQKWFEPYERLHLDAAVMDLGGGYAKYLASLKARSPKLVKSLNYQQRRLTREFGEVTFNFDVRSKAQLQLLQVWKSEQYQRKGRTDRFARPWVVDLVEQLHAWHSEDFAGLLSMLYVDGRPVAGHFGLRAGPAMISWFPAYDEEFARYSPGLVQHLRMAEAAAAFGVESIDLGPGVGWHYKQQLKSREVTVSEGCVRRRSVGGAAHWARRAPVDRTRNFILGNKRLYGLADRVLKGTANLRSR